MTQKSKLITPQMILLVLIYVVGVPMLPLIISGKWDWWEAWLFVAVNIISFITSRFLAGRKHPDLLVERGRYWQNPKPENWDKILSPLVAFGPGFISLVAGFDHRFGHSAQFNLAIKITAIIFILAGVTLASYSLIINRFFSGTVRIQFERDHYVVSTGPYRWIRHPGYAGFIINVIGTPFLLDSWWALIPVGIVLVLIIIRTALEDKTLQKKLEGYKEYSQKVPYRLFPGIW